MDQNIIPQRCNIVVKTTSSHKSTTIAIDVPGVNSVRHNQSRYLRRDCKVTETVDMQL